VNVLGAAVSIRSLSHAFLLPDGSPNRVLEACSFSIEPGEFVSIVGPSGSGKTTLFNCIAGLANPGSGEVTLDGVAVDGPSRDVAYMLQKDLLLPWRTALENVTLGLELRGISPGSARDRAAHMLQRYGLRGFENAYPRTLSGGMRQRVALIRTLILNPRVVLLDEPFSALDYQTRLLLECELRRLVAAIGCTVILVTHDIEEAIAISDRVVVLGGRPASVKSIHSISMTTEGVRTPLNSREAPEYRGYHAAIWGDLEITTEAAA